MLEISKEIESEEFSINVNLASGFRTFVRAVYTEPVVKTLLADEGDDLAVIFMQRIDNLFETPFDAQYEHPCDAAIATCLLILWHKDSDIAYDIATNQKRFSNCWWARKMAEHILIWKPLTSNGETKQMV
jgi:hypothetical protein